MRLPVRGSTPPDPGDRRDLSNTFRQLSYPNLTPSRFHLLLSRIGERDGDRNNRAMMRGRHHADNQIPAKRPPWVRNTRLWASREQAVTIFALALTAMPVLAPLANENQRPFSCRLLADEQRKCARESCDQQAIERLKRECLRDGGSALLFPRADGPGTALSDISRV